MCQAACRYAHLDGDLSLQRFSLEQEVAEGGDGELQYLGLVLVFGAIWRAWKNSEHIFRLLGDLATKVSGVVLRLRGLDAGWIYIGIGWGRMEWLESGPVFVKQERDRPWLGE